MRYPSDHSPGSVSTAQGVAIVVFVLAILYQLFVGPIP